MSEPYERAYFDKASQGTYQRVRVARVFCLLVRLRV